MSRNGKLPEQLTICFGDFMDGARLLYDLLVGKLPIGRMTPQSGHGICDRSSCNIWPARGKGMLPCSHVSKSTSPRSWTETPRPATDGVFAASVR
jgi:hypothetical protein